jgi:hypothetical protein
LGAGKKTIDGYFDGLVRNLDFARLEDPFSVPWYITRIYVLVKRAWNIQEAAAYDPENLVAPKELWPLHQADELERWFKERREMKQNG